MAQSDAIPETGGGTGSEELRGRGTKCARPRELPRELPGGTMETGPRLKGGVSGGARPRIPSGFGACSSWDAANAFSVFRSSG